MEYESGPSKAKANLRKHAVSFVDAAMALEDPRALTMADPDASGEQRFDSLGADPSGRVLVTVFTPRGRRTRLVSSRKAGRNERRACESQ
ncbi:MAG: BrnT family toxin [Gammaproteobacteria bacterium]|nr:BrnT family toxin [Gammaproteobacteria bacterium]